MINTSIFDLNLLVKILFSLSFIQLYYCVWNHKLDQLIWDRRSTIWEVEVPIILHFEEIFGQRSRFPHPENRCLKVLTTIYGRSRICSNSGKEKSRNKIQTEEEINSDLSFIMGHDVNHVHIYKFNYTLYTYVTNVFFLDLSFIMGHDVNHVHIYKFNYTLYTYVTNVFFFFLSNICNQCCKYCLYFKSSSNINIGYNIFM